VNDSVGNSDGSQASAYVAGDGDDDGEDDNEDRALWDESDFYFFTMPFRAPF
jgi:hypothetical protein